MMPHSSVIIHEPDALLARIIAEHLESDGFDALVHEDPESLVRTCLQLRPSCMILGTREPRGGDLQRLVTELTGFRREMMILAVLPDTAADIVESLQQQGVSQVLFRPFHPRQVGLLLNDLFAKQELSREAQKLHGLLERRHYLEQLIGGAPAMRAVYQLIDEIALNHLPVLVLGEPGTEKLAAARSIHHHRRDRDSPLAELQLDRMAPAEASELLLGDIRGHALSPLLRQAEGGTLILHEVHRLDPPTQHALAELLQGGDNTGQSYHASIGHRFRLITTSSLDLFQLTTQGAFNRELYYRINVVQMMLPPLRERLDDLPMLANHFLRQANKRLGTRSEGFHYEAFLTLAGYDWPRNLDELQEAVSHAARNCQTGLILREHLPMEIFRATTRESNGGKVAGLAFREARDRFELQYFSDLMTHCKGNMTQAADISGVGRPYLYKKLQEFQLRPSDFRSRRRSTQSIEQRDSQNIRDSDESFSESLAGSDSNV